MNWPAAIATLATVVVGLAVLASEKATQIVGDILGLLVLLAITVGICVLIYAAWQVVLS